MTTTYTATAWGDTYRLRADWSRSESPIMRCHTDDDYEEDTWHPTGHQVSSHTPQAAMRAELASAAVAGGDRVDTPAIAEEITLAILDMQRG